MAVQRYEFSLLVLKKYFIDLTREIFFQHEKRNFVSPRGHVMFYKFYCINTETHKGLKRVTRVQCS